MTDKKLFRCAVLDCECENAKNDVTFPITEEDVKNWRDCILCLLTEILVIVKDVWKGGEDDK